MTTDAPQLPTPLPPLPPSQVLPLLATLQQAIAWARPQFVPLWFLTLLFALPSGWLEWRDQQQLAADPAAAGMPWMLSLGVAIVTETVLHAMVAGMGFRRLAGRPASVTDAFAMPGRELLGLLTIALLFAAIVFLAVGVTGSLYAASPGALTAALFAIGVIATVRLSARFSVAVPALLVERVSGLSAIARSARLTRGVVLRCFVLRVVQSGVVMASHLLGQTLAAGFAGGASGLVGGFCVALLLRTLAMALLTPLPAVAYLRLRAALGESAPTGLDTIFDPSVA